MFIVEGEKLVNEALNSKFKVHQIVKIEDIGEEIMSKISTLSTPSPILAVVEQFNFELKTLDILNNSYSNKIVIALDDVKDPGNFGTIIRTAEWFGVSAVLASEDCVELYNPKCVQSTMGALFRLPVIYTSSLKDELITFRENNWNLFGTFLDGSPISNNKFFTNKDKSNTVILFGNESNGISKSLEEILGKENKIFIPSFSNSGKTICRDEFTGSESLNVASSVAAILALLRSR